MFRLDIVYQTEKWISLGEEATGFLESRSG
jgi:hypothetical protein